VSQFRFFPFSYCLKRIVVIRLIAPTALHAHGIAKGKTVTSHPSVKDKLDGKYSFLLCLIQVHYND